METVPHVAAGTGIRYVFLFLLSQIIAAIPENRNSPKNSRISRPLSAQGLGHLRPQKELARVHPETMDGHGEVFIWGKGPFPDENYNILLSTRKDPESLSWRLQFRRPCNVLNQGAFASRDTFCGRRRGTKGEGSEQRVQRLIRCLPVPLRLRVRSLPDEPVSGDVRNSVPFRVSQLQIARDRVEGEPQGPAGEGIRGLPHLPQFVQGVGLGSAIHGHSCDQFLPLVSLEESPEEPEESATTLVIIFVGVAAVIAVKPGFQGKNHGIG